MTTLRYQGPNGQTLRARVGNELRVIRSLGSGGDKSTDALRLLQWRFICRATPVVAVDHNGIRFFVSTRDIGVGLPVFMRGAFEPDQMNIAVDVMARITGHPFGDRQRMLVDIGANIGTASIQAIAHHGARGAIAFEPDLENLALLRHNVLANNMTERVSVVESAVTDRCGQVLFEHAKHNLGDHRVRLRRDATEDRFGEFDRPVTSVPGVTLDSEIERGAFALGDIGLVSIDTQGHEAQVLAGASQLCSSDVPVMLEYWPYGLRAADGLRRLQEIVAIKYRHYVDLGNPFVGGKVAYRPSDELASLDETIADISNTNVLLVS